MTAKLVVLAFGMAGCDIALRVREWEPEHQAGCYVPREIKDAAHRPEPQPD